MKAESTSISYVTRRKRREILKAAYDAGYPWVILRRWSTRDALVVEIPMKNVSKWAARAFADSIGISDLTDVLESGSKWSIYASAHAAPTKEWIATDLTNDSADERNIHAFRDY